MRLETHDGGALAHCAGRRMLSCALMILGTVAGGVPEAAATCPTPQFSAATHFSAGTNISDLGAADLNGDGFSDLAVANATSPGAISLLFANGAGGFASPVGYSVGNASFNLAIGDFNGDGYPDLAAANRDSGTVSVRLGTGGGSYGPRADFAVGSQPLGISTGDFTGDGALDLAVSNAGSGSVSILLGTGTGGFTAGGAVAVGSGPRDSAVGDLDHDGRLDLLVANFSSNSVSVLLGLGNGTFTPAPSLPTSGGPFGIVAQDWNGDGHLDLAVSHFLSDTVGIRLGNGSGGFGTVSSYPVAARPRGLAAADLNADSTLDLAVSSFGSASIAVLTGSGTGLFSSPTFLAAENSPGAVAVGDFDGNGSPDLATANQVPGTTSIFLNQCSLAPQVPAVSVGDGTAVEGNSGSSLCLFTVSLSNTYPQTVSVTLSTSDGSAVNGQDYNGGVVDVTFLPGATTQTVPVGVLGDALDEPDETFSVNLSNPVNGSIGDGQGIGIIVDDDPAAELAIGDAAVVEGDSGSVMTTFTVSTPPSGQTITVAYQTAAGSAGAGDFTAASATLTFPPGTASQIIAVSVTGDTMVELDETFTVSLSGASGAPIVDGQGVGTIVDDDAPSLSGIELSHGSRDVYTLQPAPPALVPDVDFFRLAQKAHSSYEVVMDATSGDIGPASLDRLGADNVTVVQPAAATGPGGTRVLRWENALTVPVTNQHLRVRSGGCGTGCGADDEYRLRAYETTGAIPRFNNSGTQVSVLVLLNPTAQTVSGTASFWSLAGSPLGRRAFTLAPKATLVLNTGTVAGLAGRSGTITVAHDGGYGGLVGKAVALEPATGFSFDSPMVPRPH